MAPAPAYSTPTDSVAGATTVPVGPGSGSAFGTFGELLQGALPHPQGDFLVTFPLARWATAVFHPEPGRREVQVRPARCAPSAASGTRSPASATAS
ncbi:hypothetical protein ACWDA9_40940, partial [Streptomyces sp. NPDC001193]